jgi:hypothetical protein
MSDPTKKSIVINKSFLSGSDNSSSVQNKKSKKNTRNLSEEIIKPNKLKKMLLDKINAKRKADQNSSPSLISGGKVDTLDISKETKLFSSEFKKSLDFLDSYIGQKRNDKYKTKTLKKQNSSVSTSLNNDILKSLHSNNNNNNNNVTNPHALYPPNNINQFIQTQAYIPQHIQPAPASAPAPIPTPTQVMQYVPSISPQPRQQSAPFFQKIQLQIPTKSTQSMTPNMVSNTAPKINLAIGKTANQSLVYTELPPELQNFTPPVYSISSPSVSPMPMPMETSLDELPPLESHTNFAGGTSRDVTGSRELEKFENNNSEMIDADIYTDMIDDVETSKTSLLPSSSTFSPIKLSDDAPYGCLKGGNKPTFRTYNKTIKNNIRFADSESSSDNLYSDRQTKLKELQNKHSKKTSTSSTSSQDNKQINSDSNENDTDDDADDSGENKNNHSLRKTKVRRHLRKTITKKFKLGKQQGNIVGVLIKNNDTRKNIQKEHGLLKSKQLADVKKYLVEKSLIKIGSTAPPGVIRNIYEASMLAGEVENVGKGIGLHNFLEDKKSW